MLHAHDTDVLTFPPSLVNISLMFEKWQRIFEIQIGGYRYMQAMLADDIQRVKDIEIIRKSSRKGCEL